MEIAKSGTMEDWDKVAVLGRGSEGEVFSMRNRLDGTRAAMKHINLKSLHERAVNRHLREVHLLKRLRHPNIVSFIDAFTLKDSEGEMVSLRILMDLCDNGDLCGLLQRHASTLKLSGSPRALPNLQTFEILTQTASALKCVHENGFIHRDIKPSNILLTSKGVVKVADFGVSALLDKHRKASTMLGSPKYMSPEVYGGQLYDSKADIWSLGCVLYEMTTLSPAFNAHNVAALAVAITEGRYQEIPGYVPRPAKHLIVACLAPEPHFRPTAAYVLDAPTMQNSNDWEPETLQKTCWSFKPAARSVQTESETSTSKLIVNKKKSTLLRRNSKENVERFDNTDREGLAEALLDAVDAPSEDVADRRNAVASSVSACDDCIATLLPEDYVQPGKHESDDTVATMLPWDETLTSSEACTATPTSDAMGSCSPLRTRNAIEASDAFGDSLSLSLTGGFLSTAGQDTLLGRSRISYQKDGESVVGDDSTDSGRPDKSHINGGRHCHDTLQQERTIKPGARTIEEMMRTIDEMEKLEKSASTIAVGDSRETDEYTFLNGGEMKHEVRDQSARAVVEHHADPDFEVRDESTQDIQEDPAYHEFEVQYAENGKAEASTNEVSKPTKLLRGLRALEKRGKQAQQTFEKIENQLVALRQQAQHESKQEFLREHETLSEDKTQVGLEQVSTERLRVFQEARARGLAEARAFQQSHDRKGGTIEVQSGKGSSDQSVPGQGSLGQVKVQGQASPCHFTGEVDEKERKGFIINRRRKSTDEFIAREQLVKKSLPAEDCIRQGPQTVEDLMKRLDNLPEGTPDAPVVRSAQPSRNELEVASEKSGSACAPPGSSTRHSTRKPKSNIMTDQRGATVCHAERHVRQGALTVEELMKTLDQLEGSGQS
eukprot:gnl/MRDRNA2_/MRDRNA2_47736_c0_seq1.p1 gnl/MRDRNA2_/MRDRNA2_47736_c0~~gnl/MRDRNA2_/MRDRNA2_47736_c0_seq1.p1  ORF type:complete len:889 (+),score=175.96 gnl/MRDRNA2_/MRDRNA2_47736_c0_seq1:115-2781(+)